MSHVKEIRQKQELQAKFQLAVNSTQNHVANWLKPSTSTITSSSSNDDFFNLPIISGGSGLALSSVNPTESSDDINTIGEYIKTGKSVSSLNKKKQNSNLNLNRVIKNDSKALSALRNKMKNSNRLKHNQSIKQAHVAHTTKKPSSQMKNSNDDSDSDDDLSQKAAPKKKFNFLIDSKIKKKK